MLNGSWRNKPSETLPNAAVERDAPEMSYDDWFWERAGKIPVRVYDNKLKDELLKEVIMGKEIEGALNV